MPYVPRTRLVSLEPLQEPEARPVAEANRREGVAGSNERVFQAERGDAHQSDRDAS